MKEDTIYKYSQTEMDDRVFAFIYGCALRDAVLQKAFKGKRTWISEVSEAMVYVRAYIDRILTGEFVDDSETARSAHELAFLETARRVCDSINQYPNKPKGTESKDVPGTFHFGNAQKLINMTVKHVYAHTYSLHILGFASVRAHFRYCHCPMDSIMLAVVWKKYKEEFGAEQRKKMLNSDFCSAWGCEDFGYDEKGQRCLPERYKQFQEAIQAIVTKNERDIFPIEYDYITWKNEEKEDSDGN